MYCIRNRVSFIIVCVALLLFVTGCSTAEVSKDAESIAISVFESLWLIADEVDRDKRIAWK